MSRQPDGLHAGPGASRHLAPEPPRPRGKRVRAIRCGSCRVLGWGALALAVLLAHADPLRGQVHASGFTGAYHRGAGSHPFVYLAVGARAGASLVGPIAVEAEALHVPAKIEDRTVDLFAYRANVLVDLSDGETRPFLLVGTGFQQWRQWVCEGESCRNPRGSGQKFTYSKGLGYTVGVGSRFHSTGPLWFRIDLRYENSRFEAPSKNDVMLTLGLELRSSS